MVCVGNDTVTPHKPDLMTLAKGLTGAHLPLGSVVINENVRRQLETQMRFTGLTYLASPVARGLAAVRAYEDEKLIERSRRLGGEMLLELKRLQQKHRLHQATVRGGHGLFAILNWSATQSVARVGAWRKRLANDDPCPKSACSRCIFAVRGSRDNPRTPLVIEEREP